MRRFAAALLCMIMTLTAASCDIKKAFRTEPTDPDMSGVPVNMVNDFLVVGDTAYELYNFGKDTADDYAAVINTAAKKLPGDVNIYDILVPTAVDVTLAKSVRDKYNTDDQKAAIEYIFGQIDSRVKKVSCYDELRMHRDEYIFFKTDHHYTQRGAWYAYTCFCEAAGIKPADIDDDFTVKTFQNYHGSFYSKTDKYKTLTTADTIVAYVPNDTNDIMITQKDKKKLDWDIIHDVSDWNGSSLYNCFIGGDQPWAVITNDKVTDGSSCVVIKESYGNPFVPFLVPNYNKIYVVDYRHYASISSSKLADVVKKNNIRDVIFINNMSMTRSPSLVRKLGKFAGK